MSSPFEKRDAALGIGREIVAVRGLRRVDVPFLGGIALLDDAAHFLERGRHDRAAALRAVEERILVHLVRFVRVADEDDVGAVVAPLEEQMQQHEEALGQVLLAFAHRAGHVHEAEHDGVGVRQRLAGRSG